MARIIIRTKSTMLKIHNDPFFSDFVDEAMLRFNNKEYHYKFGNLVDFNAWYDSSAYSEYSYPGGNLVISISRSDDNITIDWYPCE